MARKNNQIPVVLSIIALVLSAYAVFTVTDLKKGGAGGAGDDFNERVNEAIDAYVAEKSGQAAPSNEPVKVSVDDDPVKGDDKAPVTIIEFSDYECPFCGRFFRDTLPQITEKYIDTGKVKYVFRDFPLSFHPNAKPAANAAECVREQGGDEMYFEYHDVLFTNQTALGVDKLKGYAADFDIDQSEFASCVDEGKFNTEVDADFADGQKAGVRGTPGFFVNGIPISGAQPYAVFESAIEDELNQ